MVRKIHLIPAKDMKAGMVKITSHYATVKLAKGRCLFEKRSVELGCITRTSTPPIPPESVPTGEVDCITDHASDEMKGRTFPLPRLIKLIKYHFLDDRNGM
jgi:hypothetical protein